MHLDPGDMYCPMEIDSLYGTIWGNTLVNTTAFQPCGPDYTGKYHQEGLIEIGGEGE